MATTLTSGLLGEAEPPTVLDASFGQVFRIWWALVWRTVFALLCATLLAAGVAFSSALLLGMLAAVLRLAPGTVDRLTQFLATGLGVAMFPVSSLLAVRSILGKHFKGFRLVLLELK
jgi:ABC-type nitrate/sulfonate/bicarbonate transport system permease component